MFFIQLVLDVAVRTMNNTILSPIASSAIFVFIDLATKHIKFVIKLSIQIQEIKKT